MRVDLKQEFKMLNGEAAIMAAPGSPLTLRDVIAEALTTAVAGDDALTMKQRHELYQRGLRVQRAGDSIDLTTDEIAEAKERIGKRYPAPLISGQAWVMIEGSPASEEVNPPPSQGPARVVDEHLDHQDPS